MKTATIAIAIAICIGTNLIAEPRDFQIPAHGILRLNVPEAWQVESRALRQPASVTLHLTPKTGDSFDIQVTTVWLDANQLAKSKPDSLKEDVERTAKQLLPRAIEKVANIEEIKGAGAIGYFFALTDGNPGPGEFKYLTQGTFLTGEVLSAFTILYRAPAAPEVDEAIRMFMDAMYVK